MFDFQATSRLADGGVSPFYSKSISYSCRFNDDDSAQMTWTPGGAGTEETWTFATWFKRCNLGSVMQLFNAAAGNEIQFTAADKIQFTTASGTLLTTQVFRDPSSWMHLCLAVDTTQATAADRVNLYINGTKVTAFDTETYPTQNEVTEFSKAAAHTIAANETDTEEFDGYLVETVYSDGTQEAVTAYGKFKSGIWLPKVPSVTYGTYGFYLNYVIAPGTGNGAGEDVSGNGEHWTEAGLAAADQVADNPTNNYPTLSSINKNTSTTLANGNLTPINAAASWQTTLATIQLPDNGKFYFEFTLGADAVSAIVGVIHPQDAGLNITAATYVGDDVFGWGLYTDGTFYDKMNNNTPTEMTGKTPAVSDVIQVAVDIDAGKIWFGVDNTWLSSGDPAAGTNEAYSSIAGDLIPAVSLYAIADAVGINFGQLGFTYTPPLGFLAFCSSNITDPTILESNTGFDVVKYEGTGAEKVITDLEFQPDLVWIKNRDATDEHVLTDSVRGVTKELNSNSANVESTVAQGLKAFGTSGFTLGTDDRYNTNGESFVAWCFRMGAKYGFDIQTYVGTGSDHAESHSLSAVPELIIVKCLDGAYGWAVYHHHALNKTDPETDYSWFNTTGGWLDNDNFWNDTAPTTTQFTVGGMIATNENAKNYITYLWRSISGFSKVGSFEGNGNAAGTVVYCGFRPAYVLIKSIDSTSDWHIYDYKREGYNVDNDRLIVNDTDVEGTANEIDLLSNGFKLRVATDPNVAETYIYLAYAEQPGKYSNAK